MGEKQREKGKKRKKKPEENGRNISHEPSHNDVFSTTKFTVT